MEKCACEGMVGKGRELREETAIVSDSQGYLLR